MATPDGFKLGLLPESKLNRRALATSYSLVTLLIVLMINAGLIWPDRLPIARQYHVTELIPLQRLQPKPLNVKTPPRTIQAKLLPAAPVFERPKLAVPREIRVPRPQHPDEAPPTLEVNNFTTATCE